MISDRTLGSLKATKVGSDPLEHINISVYKVSAWYVTDDYDRNAEFEIENVRRHPRWSILVGHFRRDELRHGVRTVSGMKRSMRIADRSLKRPRGSMDRAAFLRTSISALVEEISIKSRSTSRFEFVMYERLKLW